MPCRTSSAQLAKAIPETDTFETALLPYLLRLSQTVHFKVKDLGEGKGSRVESRCPAPPLPPLHHSLDHRINRLGIASSSVDRRLPQMVGYIGDVYPLQAELRTTGMSQGVYSSGDDACPLSEPVHPLDDREAAPTGEDGRVLEGPMLRLYRLERLD